MHTNIGKVTGTTALKKTNLTLLSLDASAANPQESHSLGRYVDLILCVPCPGMSLGSLLMLTGKCILEAEVRFGCGKGLHEARKLKFGVSVFPKKFPRRKGFPQKTQGEEDHSEERGPFKSRCFLDGRQRTFH